jgi:hypothetical protein
MEPAWSAPWVPSIAAVRNLIDIDTRLRASQAAGGYSHALFDSTSLARPVCLVGLLRGSAAGGLELVDGTDCMPVISPDCNPEHINCYWAFKAFCLCLEYCSSATPCEQNYLFLVMDGAHRLVCFAGFSP